MYAKYVTEYYVVSAQAIAAVGLANIGNLQHIMVNDEDSVF